MSALMPPVSPDIPDPRKLVFITPGKDFPHEEAGLLEHVSPNATIVRTGLESAQQDILARIAKQYAQYGTLKEIVIDTHGEPDQLFPGKTDALQFGMRDVLSAIRNMERDGIKVADRIVFTGCNTLTEMAPAEVDDLRHRAQDMRSEIVGYRTTSVGDSYQEGRAVVFAPDGAVHTDRLDTPLATTSITLLSKVFGINTPDKDDSWFHCHNGATQAEGAACQTADAKRAIQSTEILAHTVSLGDGIVTTVQAVPDNLLLSSRRPDQWQSALRQMVEKVRSGEVHLDGLDPRAFKNEWLALCNIPFGTSFARQAVSTHEAFIAGLSPEAQQELLQIVAAQDRDQTPSARADGQSRPPMKSALGVSVASDTHPSAQAPTATAGVQSAALTQPKTLVPAGM